MAQPVYGVQTVFQSAPRREARGIDSNLAGRFEDNCFNPPLAVKRGESTAVFLDPPYADTFQSAPRREARGITNGEAHGTHFRGFNPPLAVKRGESSRDFATRSDRLVSIRPSP